MSDEIELTDEQLREMERCERFLDSVAHGVPALLAGIEVGWTPKQTRVRLQDPDFAEMVRLYSDLSVDSVERALFKLANSGHLGAIQMVLYNRRAEQWRDVRRIEVRSEATVNVNVIAAAKDAALDALRSGGVLELQSGGTLDGIIDVESSES